MKFQFTFFVMVLSLQISFAQKDSIKINGVNFLAIKTIRENVTGTKDSLLQLYRLDNNGKAKYLLTHYLFAKETDCNNIITTIGSMTIKGDSIIFLKHYLQSKKNRDPIPEWKKQIYKVTASGKLLLLYNKSKKRNSDWVKSGYNDDLKIN